MNEQGDSKGLDIIPAMIHEVLPVGPLQCNCSILGDEDTRTALVVDPGDELEKLQKILDRHQLKVEGIIITHAHADHVGAAAELRRRTGAPVYMNENDLWIRDYLDVQAALLNMRPSEKPEIDVMVRDADTVKLADTNLVVLHTPGHTQGSISLHLPSEEKLIAGDTLFRDSIGRTDLPGGDSRAILVSIRDKLLTLHDETIVIPGHGPETTIGHEREFNYFLQNL